jgi:3-isopropylmalate/(R)-2-methylmalate dehydratase small subunit|tara:strand:+ start:150 stop:752 length:603 start_codon:yes stop_codon:yes gene_type:complete
MALEKITSISGKGIYVHGDDIDTDRIIPARFMKCVTFDGLGEYLFHDVRKDPEGNEKEHNLNDPRFSQATLLLSGNNFGCGSSREHAPQAIYRAGFRAVIAEGYAEIFFGNCTGLGIPCIQATKEQISEIASTVEKDPNTEIEISIENSTVSYAGKTISIQIREGAKKNLVAGKWDPIAELLEAGSQIDQVAGKLNYMKS